MDASEIIVEEGLIPQKGEESKFPIADRCYSKSVKERLRIPTTHSKTGTHRGEVKVSVENFKAIRKSLN